MKALSEIGTISPRVYSVHVNATVARTVDRQDSHGISPRVYSVRVSATVARTVGLQDSHGPRCHPALACPLKEQYARSLVAAQREGLCLMR